MMANYEIVVHCYDATFDGHIYNFVRTDAFSKQEKKSRLRVCFLFLK